MAATSTTTAVDSGQLSLFDGWPKEIQGDEGSPEKVPAGTTIPEPIAPYVPGCEKRARLPYPEDN